MIEQDDSVFDTNTVVDVVEGVADPDTPSQFSPEWNDYVMSKFLSDELIEINGDKYPNCYGLRRVTEELIGDIVESKPVNIIVSDDANGTNPGRVICQYEVTVLLNNGNLKTVGDVAEVFSLNCDDLFLAYPAATAVTRAEGRCLRKILKLKCVAAEEITRNKDVAKAVQQVIKSSPTDGNYKEEDPISAAQINLLVNKCKEMSIDMMKYINIGEKKYTKIEEVSKRTAINMIKLLNEYQNNSKQIPVEIRKGA